MDEIQNRYQQILDNYSRQMKSASEVAPLSLDAPEPSPAILPLSTKSISRPTSRTTILKLFMFVILLFCLTAGYILLRNYQQRQDISSPDVVNDSVPTVVPVDPNSACLLNDSSYPVGESFVSADGCNICTCNPDLAISCTEVDCVSSTASPTQSVPPVQSSEDPSLTSFLLTYIKNSLGASPGYIFTVNSNENGYASGTYNLCPQNDCFSVNWLAQKDGSTWSIKHSGQESISCLAIKQYAFPSSFPCTP